MHQCSFKTAFSSSVAITLIATNLLLVTPQAAFAEGVLKLRPLQKGNDNYSSTTYDNSKPSAAASQRAANGVSAYDTYYNNPNANYNAPATEENPGAGAYAMNAEDGSSDTLRGRVISLAKGTLMSVHVDHTITAATAKLGDPVTATLENDVYSNDSVAIPAGSQVMGQVSAVNPPGHLGKHGELDIRFDTVKLSDGRVVTIPAHVVTQDQSGMLKGDTYTKDVFKGVGISAGGAGVGVLAGTAAGGLLGAAGTGALFGLGVGALAGMGYAAARKGKDVVIASGSRMSLMIDSPVTFNN